MKKRLLSAILSLVLVVGLLPAAALAVDTKGTIAARIGVTENSTIKYNGQNTLEIGFYVQSDDMPIRAGQSAVLAIDLTVLDLVMKTGAILTDELPTKGAPLTVSGKMAYSLYSDPTTFNTWIGTVYAGKSADGNTGYLILEPTLHDPNASSIVNETMLMSSLVGFKAGKTKADLTKDSVRLATPAEANNFGQTSVMLINDGDKINMVLGNADGKPDSFVIPPFVDLGNLVSTGPAVPTEVTLTASATDVSVGTEVTFTASAKVTDNGSLSYTLKDDDGVVAPQQSSNTFKVTPKAAGTKNYYVTATNTLNGLDVSADSAKVAVTAAGYSQLLNLFQDSANMMVQQGTGKRGFTPAVTDYQLFFDKGQAIDFTVTPVLASGTTAQYSLDGGANYTSYTAPFKVTDTATSVWIKVSNTGAADTIYKISLVKRTQDDPKATFKLTNEGQGISKLTLTGFENADLTTFDLVLNLTDANTFAGFCDKNGNKLVGTETDPFELNAAGSTFMVSYFTATDTKLTVHFTMGPGNTGSVDASKLAMNIYLIQKDAANPAIPFAAVKTINAIDSAVELLGFDSKKWTEDGSKALIELTADQPDYTLDMYFNKAGNNKNIKEFTYSIQDKATASNLVTDQPLAELIGKLSMKLNNGTYTVTVKGDGYLVYTKEITIDKASQEIPAIMLLAGDLDGNDIIDNTDMLKLLAPTIYNQAVGGTVTKAYDFNSDGQVDILDLGILIRNIGATY